MDLIIEERSPFGVAMTDWPPRVLSNLYRNGLQTFYDLLFDLITKSLRLSDEGGGCGGDYRLRAAERLIADGDPPEYCTLLKQSYAVILETTPTLGHVSFEQRWTQEQARPLNLLCDSASHFANDNANLTNSNH